jgi:hypothetical protein
VPRGALDDRPHKHATFMNQQGHQTITVFTALATGITVKQSALSR